MKKVILGLVATVFMGVLSVNAQERLSTTIDFELMSQHTGPCVKGYGCVQVGGTIKPGTSYTAVSKLNENTIVLIFSEKFYQENERYLSKGFTVETSYSLPKELTEKLGFRGEFIVPKKNHKINKKGNEFEVEIVRK